jgi:hypothetical protein
LGRLDGKNNNKKEIRGDGDVIPFGLGSKKVG